MEDARHTGTDASWVTVVVHASGPWPTLARCLETLRRQDWPHIKPVVLEWGGRTASVEPLADAFPQAVLVTAPPDLGPAAAINAVVNQAATEYVALVAGNVMAPINLVSRLMQTLESRSGAALVGSSTYDTALNIAHTPFTEGPNLTGATIRAVFRDERPSPGSARVSAPVFAPDGRAVMFRRSMVGLPFDAEHEHAPSVTFLAWRARLLGYEVVRLADLIVRPIDEPTAQASDDDRVQMEISRRVNFLTLFSGRTRLRLWPLVGLARLCERRAERKAGLAPVGPRARAWIRDHGALMRAKRSEWQRRRAVPDAAIIRFMSGRITNDRGFGGTLANALAAGYLRAVCVVPWERARRRRCGG